MAVYLNRIATAVPDHDIHARFLAYMGQSASFNRIARRAQIDHRYSVLPAGDAHGTLDARGFYAPGAFPTTGERMQLYKQHALPLASQALDQLGFPAAASEITHVLVTSCTGFYAPGIDLDIIRAYGLQPDVERSVIGFMGCYAAINALKLAHHIVTAQSQAVVLIVNIELCTLHFQETQSIEQSLAFLHFADGCAASIVSSQPHGIALQRFRCAVLPRSDAHITWHIGDQGFDMVLSSQVPALLARELGGLLPDILATDKDSIRLWAIHPGGRAVLDAVAKACLINEQAMRHARHVLREYGNMSSATLMFVFKALLESGDHGEGCAMAFGPGLTAETLRFSIAP